MPLLSGFADVRHGHISPAAYGLLYALCLFSDGSPVQSSGNVDLGGAVALAHDCFVVLQGLDPAVTSSSMVTISYRAKYGLK